MPADCGLYDSNFELVRDWRGTTQFSATFSNILIYAPTTKAH
jgi:hypothetical protein